jgi:Mrp family chromosome partitioning ATPase
MLTMPVTEYLGMDLPRFLVLVRTRAWLIGAIVGGAFLLALVVSLLQPSRYEATADLLFGRTSTADAIVAGGITDTGVVPEREAATNLALASLDGVAIRVKRELKTSASIQELKGAVAVNAEGASDLGTVTANWNTPDAAAAVANAFASQIVALRREAAQADIQRAIDALNTSLTALAPPAAAGAAAAPETEATRRLRDRISQLQALKALETGGVRVVEEATPPQGRSSPKPLRNALIAAFVALALALFLVALLARFDERISDEDEVAALIGAPVLARIPRVRSRWLLPARTAHESPTFLEAFEFLRLNLQLMEPERDTVVVAVTSPAARDGKTTVVSWLARSLAVGGAEVTAVDFDMRKPELDSYLSAVDRPGNGGPPDRDEDGAEPVSAARPAGGRRVYTAEDVTAGLSELAHHSGNVRRASRSLKSAGRDIPESTLRRWKVQHAPLYAELGATRTMQVTGGSGADDGMSSVDLTRPTKHLRLRLLTGTDHPTIQLGPDRLQRLFAQLRENAEYVLVDTVPVSTVADASAVAAAADGVILVLDLETTRRRDLLAAKKQLRNARAEVRGIVLNRAAIDHPAYVYEDLDDPLADQPGE